MNTQQNVLFIITHDVGPVYGAYGNDQIHSPNIDALAKESIRFDSHYCQWPLCGPSRANIFSGCRPLTTRRFDNQPFFAPFRQRSPSDFASLPEYFARSGSRSRGIGFIYHDDVDDLSWSEGHHKPTPDAAPVPKWAEGWLDADSLLEWKSCESLELIRQRLQVVKDSGASPESIRSLAGMRRARGPAVEVADVSDDAYHDGKVAESACSFLTPGTELVGEPDFEGRSRIAEDVPYVLGVGFLSPHTPFRAPRRYWDLYDRNALRLYPNREWPVGSEEWMAGDSEPAQYYTTDGYTKPWRANEAQLRELLHGHYATISYIDALIGRVIAAAKTRGDWDDTIVVFTSDHGFSEGQHGYWGKHNMWDASLRVPLFIKPGRKGVFATSENSTLDRAPHTWPVSISRVTEHVDVYPTLCELAGLPIPAHCEGLSLVPLIEKPSREWKDAALSHRKHIWHDRLQVYDLGNSLRTPRYRYTEYLDAAGELLGSELFDYVEDPQETRNLAADSGYRGTCAPLAKRLRSAVQTSGKSLKSSHDAGG
jgi:iduronate 2-sulfatase